MDVRIGARFRALRHRLGWRQLDLATRAGVSRSLVSLLERGRVEQVSIASMRSIAKALDAEVMIQLRWRGGDLDRLVDEGHAALVGAVAARLTASGWRVQIEVTYSVYGERGSIDILASHAASPTLLVVEVKTELTSIEETLRKHGEKARLAPWIAEQQLGWKSAGAARLLVLPDLSTPRRRVDRHRAVLDPAYPLRGHALRSWLQTPGRAESGLLFIAAGDGPSHHALARKRIRCAEAPN